MNIIIQHLKKTNKIKNIFSLIISIFMITIFYHMMLKSSINVYIIFKNLDYIIFSILIVYITIFLRAYRYHYIIYNYPQSNYKNSLELTFKSITINNLLPFKLGEFYRIFITKKITNDKYLKIVLLLFFERLIEILVLLTFILPFFLYSLY